MFRRNKPATAVRTYKLKAQNALAERWAADTPYSSGDFRRPTIGNGYEYEVTDAGLSAAEEPDWPTTIAATVDDGTVEWTCRDYATAAQDTIDSITVTAEDGLTVDSSTFTPAGEITVTLSGGTVGNVYDVTVSWVTTAGETDSETIRITVTE